MPYTKIEKKLMARLIKKYGAKRALEIYHGMLNSKNHDAIFGTRSKNKRDHK